MMLQLRLNGLQERHWMTLLMVAAFALCAASAMASAETQRPAYVASFLGFAVLGALSVRWRADRDASDRLHATQIPAVRTFDDVAGLDEVRKDLDQLVDYIRNREKYLALDAQLPRGVLLYGPPGTGKTLLAKALAAEAHAKFHYASGASFVEKYVGVGPQRVRDLFITARKSAPSIIFIDEIDSIGRSRTTGEHAEWDSTLNQLLTEIDGFSTTDNVLLVCATNRRELLDSALLRPGRLDRQVYIGLPDLAARAAILKVHTRRKPLAADVDLAALARRTPGVSGAHLAAMVNEAALAAAQHGNVDIGHEDFVQGLERVLSGLAGRNSVLSHAERRVVAYHEAGHAVVGHALDTGSIERISLLSRSQALGYVLQIPEERMLQTRQSLINRITTLLAGRAAEEICFGDISTGARDDLEKATSIAEQMVLHYGMGSRHHVVRDTSLALNPELQAEIQGLFEQAHISCRKLITEQRDTLDRLATALLEKETLEAAQLAELFANR